MRYWTICETIHLKRQDGTPYPKPKPFLTWMEADVLQAAFWGQNGADFLLLAEDVWARIEDADVGEIVAVTDEEHNAVVACLKATKWATNEGRQTAPYIRMIYNAPDKKPKKKPADEDVEKAEEAA